MNPSSEEYLVSAINVSVDSLAKNAGLVDEDFPEEARVVPLRRLLVILQRKPRPEEDKIHAEFAAKHLPLLTEKYRQNTGAINTSVYMLNVLSHTAYFVRFQQTSAGQGLAAIQAKRIVESAPDMSDADTIAETCQFFSTLLVLQGVSGIDEADRTALLRILRRWKRTYNGMFASVTSDRCLSLLADDESSHEMMGAVKGMLEVSLTKCGGKGCTKHSQANGSPLMQCSRCKVAVYCCSEHQKQAWPNHKATCFPSVF